jgi:hypothetical protein
MHCAAAGLVVGVHDKEVPAALGAHSMTLPCPLSVWRCGLCCMQLLDPGGRRTSPQFMLFRELVIRAYLAVGTGGGHSGSNHWRDHTGSTLTHKNCTYSGTLCAVPYLY